MSIDPAIMQELFPQVQRQALFGSQLPAEQIMRNVMRQSGIAYSPSNPVTQYLMRMAPALQLSYMLTQAQAGALPGGGLPDDATGVLDFFTRGLGQGRNMISSALGTLPDFIRGIRNEGAPGEGDLSPLTNSYRNVLRQALANPENVTELFGTLQSPFLSAKNAQLAEQGRAMLMGDLYGEAAGRGQDIIDYLFGAKPAPKPFDLAPLPGPTAGGVPALPAPVPAASGATPGTSAWGQPLLPRIPEGGTLDPATLGLGVEGSAVTDEGREMLLEAWDPEGAKERKRRQLKGLPAATTTVRG